MSAPSDLEASLAIVGYVVFIGVGATLAMDLWAAMLWRCFRVPALDYALVGRWIGHFPRGRFSHESIGHAASVRHERVIGWIAHYTIGVAFAALLLAVCGREWINHPTLNPPLIVSSVTLIEPFFVMQPAMGVGIAASRTPRPNVARLRSLATHTVHGLGLYASAWLWAVLTRTKRRTKLSTMTATTMSPTSESGTGRADRIYRVDQREHPRHSEFVGCGR